MIGRFIADQAGDDVVRRFQALEKENEVDRLEALKARRAAKGF